MDHITQQLDMYIQQYDKPETQMVALQYVRVKIEYGLVFILGYLWNKKHKRMRNDVRVSILRSLRKPTVGQIINNIKLIDYDHECDTKGLEALDAYKRFRNEYLGHGYIFPDQQALMYQLICELEHAVYRIPILQQRYDLVYVEKETTLSVSGIRYVLGGLFDPWNANRNVHPFLLKHVYAVKSGLFRVQYIDLSPFVLIEHISEFYLLRNVEEYLTGRVIYNRILRTGTLAVEYEEFSDVSLEQNELKRRSVNNTIINHYANNYHTYFEVGPLKQKIQRFLKTDRANVCCTIWGHGGVGKTALVQSIIDALISEENRTFEYIIFASAKDRHYNVYINQIEERSGHYTSYEGVMRLINQVVFSTANTSAHDVLQSNARMLFVIDDFETFPDEEKRKIEEFIRSLDINRHKVVITTRANTVIGEVFNVDELDPITASNFVTQLLTSGEYQIANVDAFIRQLEEEETYLRVHEVTQGRPLFLYALVSIWVQERSLANTLQYRFGTYREAIDFLYGRVYDYLSPLAQDIFVVMSQIVNEQDLTNLTEKLYYILDMSMQPPFEKAMRELVKLRIIEEIDSTFFRIYSAEILMMMRERYQQRSVAFQQQVAQRIAQISVDPRLNNDRALLQNALAARHSLPKEQVVAKFKVVLNNASCAHEIKLEAICSLGEYVAEICLDPQNAIELMVSYVHIFSNDVQYVRQLASYYWVTWQRRESIDLIQGLFTNHILEYQKQPMLWLELKGTLVERQCIEVLSRFDEESRAHEAFTLPSEQLSIFQAQFRMILQSSGRDLWERINDVSDVAQLEPRIRICIIKGLYQMVLLYHILVDTDKAQAICDMVLTRFPANSNLYDQFRQLQRKITQSIGYTVVSGERLASEVAPVPVQPRESISPARPQRTPEEHQKIMLDYIVTETDIGNAYPLFREVSPVLRPAVIMTAWRQGGVWRAFVAGLADSSILTNVINMDITLQSKTYVIQSARQFFVRNDVYIDPQHLLEIIMQANQVEASVTEFNVPQVERSSTQLNKFINHVRRSKNIGEGYPLFKNIDSADRMRAIQVAWRQGSNWRALVAGLANEYTMNTLYSFDSTLRARHKAIDASRQYFQRNDIHVDQTEMIQTIRTIHTK